MHSSDCIECPVSVSCTLQQIGEWMSRINEKRITTERSCKIDGFFGTPSSLEIWSTIKPTQLTFSLSRVFYMSKSKAACRHHVMRRKSLDTPWHDHKSQAMLSSISTVVSVVLSTAGNPWFWLDFISRPNWLLAFVLIQSTKTVGMNQPTGILSFCALGHMITYAVWASKKCDYPHICLSLSPLFQLPFEWPRKYIWYLATFPHSLDWLHAFSYTCTLYSLSS